MTSTHDDGSQAQPRSAGDSVYHTTCMGLVSLMHANHAVYEPLAMKHSKDDAFFVFMEEEKKDSM